MDDRPTREDTKITPEMIEAAADVLWDCGAIEGACYTSRYIAEEVIKAAFEARELSA